VSDAALKRMRWRCRRGMRELDVLLVAHLDAAGAGMSEREQQHFERLLDASDMDLYVWFTGRGQPDDTELAALVARILSPSLAGATP